MNDSDKIYFLYIIVMILSVFLIVNFIVDFSQKESINNLIQLIDKITIILEKQR